MKNSKKIAFLFPGQGAQYPGMGRDFFENFEQARHVFEEANDILGRNLSKLILEGPEKVLTETKNSQTAIFVSSMALLRVMESLFPSIKPTFCAGLSLGEYTALTAAGYLQFHEALKLVQFRGECMNEACERTTGSMAVVLGLEALTVEETVRACNLPNDLWVANFNCPGQIVISGTLKGIEAGSAALQAKGAKRVLPLQVHGAFHSGLMKLAEEKLAKPIQEIEFKQGHAQIAMNVPGDIVSDLAAMRRFLIQQVTNSVRWEQGIRSIERQGPELYIEFGPGKTLSAMNKRIGTAAPTLSIEKIADLDQIGAL